MPDNVVRSVCPDGKGNLWIATHGGLSKLNMQTGDFKNYFHDPQNPNSIIDNVVWRVFVDQDGIVWVGTRKGLSKLNPDTGEIISFKHDPKNPKSLLSDRVVSIYQDSKKRICIGTVIGGLSLYNEEIEGFENYQHNSEDQNSLGNNIVVSTLEGKDEQMWIGTAHGLNKLDEKTQSFKIYTEKEGLPNNIIYGVLSDSEGNLWMSTNKGISRFDPEAEAFTNFDINDGLQNNEFNNGAYYKSKDGEMFFGGISGFNSFYPEEIKTSDYNPYVVITSIKVFNKEIKPEKSGHKKDEDNNELDYIKLSHKDHFISFEFSSLDFSAPEKKTNIRIN